MLKSEQAAVVFSRIFILANRLQILGDKLDENMTVKQWLFLASIIKSKQSSLTITEIANITGSSRQNTKKMALILEKQGFVNVYKDSNDARVIRVSLADKCGDYFDNRADLEIEFMENLFAGFDTEILDGLYKGIMKLSENIHEMESKYE